MNSLHRGFIDRPILGETIADTLVEVTPMGRLGTPAEVVEAMRSGPAASRYRRAPLDRRQRSREAHAALIDRSRGAPVCWPSMRPPTSSNQRSIARLDLDRPSGKLLVLCLGADAVLIGAHLLHTYSGLFADPTYSIAQERGFGETFQYLKEGWIVLMLGIIGATVRNRMFLAWGCVFGILLIDDLFILRERLGVGLAEASRLDPLLGLRPQDLGEVVVVGVLGLVVVAAIVIGYVRNSPAAQSFARTLGLLLVGLFAFGVVLDAVHVLVLSDPIWDGILGTVEEGGEMVIMSLVVAFVFRTWQSAARFKDAGLARLSGAC